ncbi:MAG TPA: response regulator transcription factor [Clostridia bacterium]|nr:response regulator transcription factor [Clostridia bacterium]
MEKTKLIIVDDHEVVRYGLRLFLESYDHLAVVGEAQTLAETISLMERVRPSIVILDVLLKNECGIQCCKEIMQRYPDTRIIILTSFGNEEVILKAIKAGAKGFVLKDTGNEELIKAINAAIKGESLLDPLITHKLLNHLRQISGQGTGAQVHLSQQERRVLALLSEGLSNREIANKILLSEKTVRNYVSKILNKLNLNNRAEAAVYAAKHGIRYEQ